MTSAPDSPAGGTAGVMHTPGPWEAIASVPSEGFEAYWIKAQPHPAMRGFTKEIGCVNGPQSGVQEANARLIAAAPDLLEALLAIREWLLDTDLIEKKDAHFWNEAFVKANNTAHAALAKATASSQ